MRAYTEQDKLQVKAMLIAGETATDIAKATNIPVRTVRDWKYKLEKTDVRYLEAKRNFEEEFINNCNEIICQSQELILEQLKASKETGVPIDITKLNNAIGVHYDKRALASGQATSIDAMVIEVKVN